MKPINTALCSFGMSGQVFHAPFVDVNPNFSLYGVLERTKNLAQEKYPDVKTYRTLEELLSDEAVELVVVNTPNSTHYEYTRQIIEAKKHVVVEKPFTASFKEAEALISLAEKHGVKLSVYQNRRWDSDFKTVKKIIDEDSLGNIVEVEMHYDRFAPELSYKIHKEIPAPGVGILYDLGSHIIDQALHLFGMPLSVFASVNTFRETSKVTDYFDVKLYYPSHYATLKSSYFVLEPLPAYIVHGTNGSFIKSKADIQEAELQKEVKPDTANWGVEPESEMGLLHILENGKSKKELIPTERGNYMAFYDGVFEAIRNDKPVPVSATEAAQVIKIIEVALESNKTKRVIDL
ncbi:Gfo/Idh/MocA family oxidoreductase [Muricauda sp. CAU 1633]|uniref:Gfo/Idh/MocA family oxidoreductase n=1 Tax=Allomuricauda sp. CAU 1633 TaxID=2816036 RepID=UPI001A8C705A|nr:Gfo/Idh/MocA family oxidoreductase [Muricauda sp. CAU 1633]MBO0324064.1 Gfo/Idh/MocA family oxidoreductase [Muricauda sp. CAU 1633]